VVLGITGVRLARGSGVAEMRRALVTGPARGIGRALVTELSGRGLEVVAVNVWLPRRQER
jgi:NAD(P)-dependent dehydrogenase (short-subunit alcohol dehydrogenase family)